MTTNQEGKQTSFRAIGGTTDTYNGDAMAAFIAEGATGSSYNDLFISWLKIRTGSSNNNLPDLMAEFAISEGFDRWDAITTFTSAADTFLLETGDILLLETGDNLLLQ